jgi:hypothetical protein
MPAPTTVSRSRVVMPPHPASVNTMHVQAIIFVVAFMIISFLER